MRLSLARVPAYQRSGGRRGGATLRGARAPLSRSFIAHLVWSATIIVAAAAVIGVELASPCPPGGPIAFGNCERVRPFAIGVLGLSALLYVAGLSGVRWWTAGLRRRGVADAIATRDWYLLGAGIGLVVAPLLAFTFASALR